MDNRSVPTATVLPHLVYRNMLDACDWLTRVFGFIEHYRHGQPVSGIQMHLGEAYIMLAGPGDDMESPSKTGYGTQMLTVLVADVVLTTLRQNEKARLCGRSFTKRFMANDSTASETSKVIAGCFRSTLAT